MTHNHDGLRLARLTSCVAATMLVLGASCGGTSPTHLPTARSSMAARVANLHAFSRIYGVLRWFHPSDAAADVDWDLFAIEGVRRVIDAPDRRALRAALVELIAPIAPTAQLIESDQRFADDRATRTAGAGLDSVAWEHRGYGDSTVTSEYVSKRRHRDRIVAVPGKPFASLWQAVDAMPFRGTRVRLRGKLRTAHHGQGQLWLRVDSGDVRVFFDNMDDRPIVSSQWATAEVIGTVTSDATRIVFGVLMGGGGTTWYDDIELATETRDGSWKPVAIENAGFESEDVLSTWKPGTGRSRAPTVDGWSTTRDRTTPASGAAALRIEAITKVEKDELFEDAPLPGEVTDIDLGNGLRARIPLSIYSKAGHTLGDAPASAHHVASAPAVGFDAIGGIGDVIVVWNVLEHFWPYWDRVSVDWIQELDSALVDALDDRSVDDHVATLQPLSAAAPDGHANTSCRGEHRTGALPLVLELIEGQVTVIASTTVDARAGDVLISLDDRPAIELLTALEALASGTTQWRQFQALLRLGVGPVGTTIRLRLRREGTEFDAMATRGEPPFAQATHPAIERLDDGVYYIDLSRAELTDMEAIMDRLVAAPGVVFDVRKRPLRNFQILSHLLTHDDDSKAWLAVPHIIRPDHTAHSISGWDFSGWAIPALQPHISGRVAFLTGPEAISYAETVMSFVKHYHLGEIVGSATAGTNGNIAEITEPTGCRTLFTGMRITNHDGSPFHLIGVQPTIPAHHTIAGVAAGRDEILERALAYVRTGAR